MIVVDEVFLKCHVTKAVLASCSNLMAKRVYSLWNQIA